LIDTVRIDDRLAILEGAYGAMNFIHLKVDDLFIYQPEWTGAKNGKTPDLSIIESVDNGVFTLQPNPKSLPNRIKLNQFIFANAYLGTDPMPVITARSAPASPSALVEVTLRTAAACWLTWIVTNESAAWRARASNQVQWPLWPRAEQRKSHSTLGV
jgi:hypothetical protein